MNPWALESAAIPEELKRLRQWVLWRGEDRLDQRTGLARLDKITYVAEPLRPGQVAYRKAQTTTPACWRAFATCVQVLPDALETWAFELGATGRGGGIGFVFAPEDPYC